MFLVIPKLILVLEWEMMMFLCGLGGNLTTNEITGPEKTKTSKGDKYYRESMRQ